MADDAAELVQVEYEALDPVVDAEEALKDESILHEEAGTNRVWNGVFEYGDVEQAFREAAYVVKIDRMHFHRFSSTPLENNVVIAQWNPKDERIYYSVQQFVSVICHPVSCRAPRTSTLIAFGCRRPISAAASESRSRAIRRWRCARWPRRRPADGRSSGWKPAPST